VSAQKISSVQNDLSRPGSGITARRPVCLVLMPMYAGFEEIRTSVARVLGSLDFEMRRLEVAIEDSEWHLWLLDSTQTSDIVLVDLTHNNPYVMYELGYVHSCRLPTVFIINTMEQRIPATVRGAVCTAYGDGCENFERDLIEHLRLLTSRRPGIVAGAVDLPKVATAELYEMAGKAVGKLEAATGHGLSRVSESEFWLRLEISKRRGAPDPVSLTERIRDRYLMTLLIEESDRVAVMSALCDWSFGRFPAPGPRD
jgi:hypothetical protein